jgi:hypothetical protein
VSSVTQAQVEPAVIEIVAELDAPIGLNFFGDPAKRYVYLCDVTYRIGGWEFTVPKGFEFDGPSIPRLLWWIGGLSPADIDTVLAAGPHDYVCEHPEVLPRILGDAIFFIALGPVVFNGRALAGVGSRRRRAMYLAVRGYSTLSRKDWT